MTTSGFPAGTLRVAPIYIPNTVRCTAIRAEVTTIGDVGALVRLGLWGSDPTNSFPKKLLSPSTGTTIPGDVVGFGDAILNPGAPTVGLVLPPGIYWTGGITENSATSVTMRSGTTAVFTNVTSNNGTVPMGLSYFSQPAGSLSDLPGVAASTAASTVKMNFVIAAL